MNGITPCRAGHDKEERLPHPPQDGTGGGSRAEEVQQRAQHGPHDERPARNGEEVNILKVLVGDEDVEGKMKHRERRGPKDGLPERADGFVVGVAEAGFENTAVGVHGEGC